MVVRKGELGTAQIDRDWPHQVALPERGVSGANYPIIEAFCKGLSVCQRHHSFRRDDMNFVVFCFAVEAHAQQFSVRFNGKLLKPKDRPKWGTPAPSRGKIS